VLSRERALLARGRAILVLVLGVAVLLVASASPVAANDPTEPPRPNGDREDRRGGPERDGPPGQADRSPEQSWSTPSASPGSTLRPQPTQRATPAPQAADPADPVIGWDISYPQCGGPYPDSPAFAIVGVNGGRVFSANPCLGEGEHPSQLEWAGREDLDLYVNTGNPGPRFSAYWPIGQRHPRECGTGIIFRSDSRQCAYVYGWNAAAYAYRTALKAFASVDWLEEDATRMPDGITWWLDVEVANSWRTDRSLNVAALQGMVAYFESMEVDEIGFYSTPRLWNRIVGSTDAFAEYPAWHGGARDLQDAEWRCASEEALTGGELRMVQWIQDGFDANIRCPED
jgi:hypothetical protein